MATSDFSVINAAALRTGNNPITSLSGGDVVSGIAAANYDDLVKAELSAYPWKRASKIEELDRIDASVHGDPPQPWTAAYQLPNDLVDIRSVSVSGYPIDYAVHGDKILCDAAQSSNVILLYIWRVPEAEWPPWFREGVTRRCEAIFLRGIGERYREAQARDQAADDQFATSRNRDSQSQTARDPVRSPTLQARIGIGACREFPYRIR